MKKLTNQEFIKRLKIINSTIIPLENFINTSTKILVKDELNIVYKISPAALLRGYTPSIKASVDKNKCFLIKANIVHNNQYDYSKVVYITNHTKVTITCPIHGDFEQTPAAHLQKRGCPHCRAKKIATSKRMSLKTFLEKANSVHNFKYTYNLTIFSDSYKKIKIICPEHGEFKQKPHAHLSGRGCPICCKENDWGYSKNQWINFCKNKKNADPKVYIVRLFNDNEEFIKIGITSNTAIFRMYGIPTVYSYEIIKEIKGSPDFVWDKEKELHKICSSFSYKPKLSFGGQTECFTLDALNHIN